MKLNELFTGDIKSIFDCVVESELYMITLLIQLITISKNLVTD